MSFLWSCIIGPKLVRIYGPSGSTEGRSYTPNMLEQVGQYMISAVNVTWKLSALTTPFITYILVKDGLFNLRAVLSLMRVATGLTLVMMFGLFVRGIARTGNYDYLRFLEVFGKMYDKKTPEAKAAMSRYDYSFWAMPVDFKWDDGESEESRSRVYANRSQNRNRRGYLNLFMNMPCSIIAFLCSHSFGRQLMYPGSVYLLQCVLSTTLVTGRETLVLKHKGLRGKVATIDGNSIDTMFVDRRESGKHPHGSTLVVTCEGNAGYYEIGIMNTPLDAGYSVLGWNHPGFGSSTGCPFPSQEQNAIDAVMQYAIHKLNFQPENIIVYAWSIGGYAGTWAAMNYPEIRGLVLDATFDDVLPLALPRMPSWMSGLVKRAIREHLNLNNSDQLCRYPGPVTIIRRTEDEIITVVENDISTNRGNDLLIKLLKYRYPNLQTPRAQAAIKVWLARKQAMQDEMYNDLMIDNDLCLGCLKSYTDDHGESFPMKIGHEWHEEDKPRMLLFLAKKYLLNYDAGHNATLKSSYFRIPWTPFGDSSYVQVE